MAVEWGVGDFEGSAWIDTGNGIGSVYPFLPGNGGLSSEVEPPHGIITPSGDLLNGTRSARGLVDTAQTPLFESGGQLAGSQVYNDPGWSAIACAGVHTIAADATSTVFKFRLRFRGDDAAFGANPNWTDPDLWRMPTTGVNDPDAGSDDIRLTLDSAQNAVDPLNPGAGQAVDYGAGPRLSIYHINHSMVWPWRVRMDETTRAGTKFAGWNHSPTNLWPTLCEARVYQFTDSVGVRRFELRVVYYPESDTNPTGEGEGTSVISNDGILLAAYTALGQTPQTLQSPFFHFDGISPWPIWDEVEVEVSASLMGFVTMRVTSVDTWHTEQVSISGLPAVITGGLDVEGNPIGLKYVDLGAAYVSATTYAGQGSTIFGTDEAPALLTWAFDDIQGSDISLTESGGATTVLLENFSNGLSISGLQSCPLSAYPRGAGEDVLFVQNSSHECRPPVMSNLSNARNWWSEEAGNAELAGAGGAIANGDIVDLDGSSGASEWSNPVNRTVRLTRTLQPTTQLEFVSRSENEIPYRAPNTLAIGAPQYKLGFRLRENTDEPDALCKVRFSNSLAGGSSTANYPGYAEAGAPPSYDYYIRVPSVRIHSGLNRANQFEIALFTPSAAETDTSGAQGEAKPPNGVGLQIRRAASTDIEVDFYVEIGSGSYDTIHNLLTLSHTDERAVTEIVLECEDLGDGDLEFHVFMGGRKFFTNAAGTADFTLPKAEIDAAGLVHGIGWQNSFGGAWSVRELAVPWAGSSGWAGGQGLYQHSFHRKVDRARYSDAAVFPSSDSTQSNEKDFVACPEPLYGVGPLYMREGRVRAAYANGTSGPDPEPFSCYSAIAPGRDETSPYPGLDGTAALTVTAKFPTLSDAYVLNGGPSRTTGHISYRGFTAYGVGTTWENLTVIAGTAAADSANVTVATYIPRGVSALLFGNPSDTINETVFQRPTIQIVAINDSGTVFTSSRVQIPLQGSDAQSFHFQLRMTEEIDGPTGDRTYTLVARRHLSGGGVDPGNDSGGVHLATVTLALTAAQFATFTSRELLTWRHYGDNAATSDTEYNTTWLTHLSVSAGSVSAEHRYEALAGVSPGPTTTTIQDVRGFGTMETVKRIEQVRGRVDGEIPEQPDLQFQRRLLVFERDPEGNVPGSVGHAEHGLGDTEVNWYTVGILGAEPGLFWGGPTFNYSDQALLDHRIFIERISYSGDQAPEMTIVQEAVAWSGGHLRAGQLVIYIEQVPGTPFEIDEESGAVYGGSGIKVLFRGTIIGVDRDQTSSSLTYRCRGPQHIVDEKTILEMTECGLGKIAYNVEPGSIQTPFAVSSNLDFRNGPPNQNSIDNVGSMLGQGIPDLRGMSLAGIIEHFISFFRDQLNSAGILRLNGAGKVTVGNLDGTAVVFDEENDLDETNEAGSSETEQPIEGGTVTIHTGPAELASIAWAPNRDAFNVIPPETLVQGSAGDIIRQLITNLPDVRWRIDPATLRWVFETRSSLSAVTVRADLPGTSLQVSDESADCFTAVIFSSPFRRQEAFKASLSGGTIHPAWLPDGYEGEWMQPFSQIGTFNGVVETVYNFPYSDPGVDPPIGPQQTVFVIKCDVGSQPLAATTFNGATFKLTSGNYSGSTASVVVSSPRGGFTPPFQFFDVTVEPAFPGGYGSGTALDVGTEVEVNDDPTEGTTNEANAYSRMWADYVMIDPTSGTPITNLAPGGTFGLTGPVGGCDDPVFGPGVQQTLPANSVVVGGNVVQSAVPLVSFGSQCALGGGFSPTECGGDIVYDAVRIQEGTWCVRSPEVGHTGTAYSDILEYEGTITTAHSDGLGFVDTYATWVKDQWGPQGGAFAKVLLIGGNTTVFSMDNYTPTATTTDLNERVIAIGPGFGTGWKLDTIDISQNHEPLEERSFDADDDVAEWHQDAGGSTQWETVMGIAFTDPVTPGAYGRTRGSIVTRYAPATYSGSDPFDPITLGQDTDATRLNNNVEVEALLTVDPSGGTDPSPQQSAVTSLCQVGLVLRAENGWVEQRRVPPRDIDNATPWFSDELIQVGDAGTNFVEADTAAEAYLREWGAGGWNYNAVDYDYIPSWITGRFKALDAPSSGTSYPALDGERVLGSKGRVIDSRLWRTYGHPWALTGYSDVTTAYQTGTTAWPTASRQGKTGLEFGTTGYVFRMVRGDEPDYLPGSGSAGVCYPTIFWYHTERVVDSTTNLPAVTDTGEPIFKGVKEVIYQGTQLAVNEAAIGVGAGLRMRLSVQQPIPYGDKSHLRATLTGLTGNDVVIEIDHDPRLIVLEGNNGNWELNHQVDFYGRSGFDGNYATFGEGFSMVRGAGGFGCGVVKAQMTDAAGNGGYTTVRAAKVTNFRTYKLNTPIWNTGPSGVPPSSLPQIAEDAYDLAKVGRVVASGLNSIRFQHDPQHPEVGFTPTAGDRYRLVFERGWNIARTATFVVDGLDDPNKVWIFRHMADSSLEETKDKRYVGTVEVPGIAYELTDGASLVNVASGEGWTGLENARQEAGSVSFTFRPTRRTSIGLNHDGRGRFSRIEEQLRELSQQSAAEQNPYWLGRDYQYNEGRQSQLATAGIDPTSVSGFGGQQYAPVCANNVYGPNGSVTNELDEILGLIFNLEVIVEANKDDEDHLPPNTQITAGEGGIVVSAGQQPTKRTVSERRAGQLREVRRSAMSRIIAKLGAEGREVENALVSPYYAVRDGDGTLYSMMLTRSGATGEPKATWVPVTSDPDEPGRYLADTSKLGQVPREKGTKVVTALIDGSASSYDVRCGFRLPIVQVVASTGYSGPAGSSHTATAGEHLSLGNCGGFKVMQDQSDTFVVSIEASSNFGPCAIYLSS